MANLIKNSENTTTTPIKAKLVRRNGGIHHLITEDGYKLLKKFVTHSTKIEDLDPRIYCAKNNIKIIAYGVCDYTTCMVLTWGRKDKWGIIPRKSKSKHR